MQQNISAEKDEDYKKPTTNVEALTLALYLAITASTDKKAQQIMGIILTLAGRMSKTEIAYAKKRAEAQTQKLMDQLKQSQTHG